jgi:hypothetical protein
VCRRPRRPSLTKEKTLRFLSGVSLTPTPSTPRWRAGLAGCGVVFRCYSIACGRRPRHQASADLRVTKHRCLPSAQRQQPPRSPGWSPRSRDLSPGPFSLSKRVERKDNGNLVLLFPSIVKWVRLALHFDQLRQGANSERPRSFCISDLNNSLRLCGNQGSALFPVKRVLRQN